jgi:uncharacterized protein
MAKPLMPKATAVWLVENTALTFQQIADFCGLHELEVQAIADQEVAAGMVGMDPIQNGQITRQEIDRCQADHSARLRLRKTDLPEPKVRQKGPRYTPVTKRGDKPDAIAWLLKQTPELSDAALCRLIGTTKNTIKAVRDKTHWNSPNIKARSPVLAGLCTQQDLNDALTKARPAGAPAREAPNPYLDPDAIPDPGPSEEERQPNISSIFGGRPAPSRTEEGPSSAFDAARAAEELFSRRPSSETPPSDADAPEEAFTTDTAETSSDAPDGEAPEREARHSDMTETTDSDSDDKR